MRKTSPAFVARLIGAFAMLTLSTAASANSPRVRAEDRLFAFDAQLPTCDDIGVLKDIQDRFKSREKDVWKSNLEITTIDKIRETAFRPNGQDLIPRRYCSARAILSSGKPVALDYFLVEDGGIFGWQGSLFLGLVQFPTPASYNVEFCLTGLDRHRTYAPGCKVARP